MRGRLPQLIVLWVCTLVLLTWTPLRAQSADQAKIDFSRQVRPILSDVCFGCHGPDAEARQAELRLDERESLLGHRDGQALIVPGDPQASLLFQRITAGDASERMPPEDAPRKLTPEHIETLRQWIADGAEWQEHWSFVAPTRPALPPVRDVTWPNNSIDYFVLAALEADNWMANGPASRVTMIRRLSLDLTGLPPTPEEVTAFVNDHRPDAYARLVDRLLDSPRFGERMAIEWLDAARFADTSGYQNDGPRHMWRWRDWVIDAFNRNQPFDQFTIEQIAGDMLPDATLDQIIATGFNRNHRGNAEGGIIPEEFAVEYVVDRVETTFSVWLGLTMGCARCHDHKYDPLRQQEFYQAYDYFNNIPEYGRAIKEGNSPPYVVAPTEHDRRALRVLDQRLADVEQQHQSLLPDVRKSFHEWLSSAQLSQPVDWTVQRGLQARWLFTTAPSTAAASANTEQQPADTNTCEPPYVAVDGTVQRSDQGPVGQAVQLDGSVAIDAGDVGDFGYFDKFSLSAWVRCDDAQAGTIVSRMTDVAEGDGYSVVVRDGRVHVYLVKRWLDDAIRVASSIEIAPKEWTHVAVTYDGSRNASAIAIYINGHRDPHLQVHLDGLNQTFSTKEPLRIGGGGGSESRFRGSIADVRVYRRDLAAEEVTLIATPQSIDQILAMPVEQRTSGQQEKLWAYFAAEVAAPAFRQVAAQLIEVRQQQRDAAEQLPTVMVMRESEQPTPSFILQRGQYDQPGEQVTAAVPSCLPPLRSTTPNNRLGFAQWLVDRDNPLTARVIVNRYWQMLFGVGLVKTTEDFGAQGEPPSHPELLDWLAVEFMESGWDVKHVLRLMVSSSTYRQHSHAAPQQWQQDPENRRLARGPRFRMPAEMLRDQALAVSGLLVEQSGGPSVKPYQPEGLWKEIATDMDYGQGSGRDLYRRSLYTYWKRTVAPPGMITFDAPPREMCIVKRPLTNTPLQALALMNEVTFVEAARKLAERALLSESAAPAERLALMFRLATCREPSAAEQAILQRTVDRNLARFRAQPDAAQSLLDEGESPADPALDACELAAYAAAASLILNLDEVVTKE